MYSTIIAAFAFLCTFGGALVGVWLRTILPEPHFTDQARDTVKLGIGLIATMTALILGLVTASAKSTFDELDKAVKHAAADLLALDRTLARYGPETAEARTALREAVHQRLEMTWPETSGRPAKLDSPEVIRAAEAVVGQIRGLSPRTDDQRWLHSRALTLGESLLDTRLIVATRLGRSVPIPFLALLIFWLTVIFTCFGLFAPRNFTVLAVLFLCTISVASAIFLILEMGGPFEGLIKISPDPLRFAYSRLNQ